MTPGFISSFYSARSKDEIDMTSGPLLGNLLRFAIPLALSGILQLLFNTVDIIVVGRFAGHIALAAVGSTTALVMLLINLFSGIAIGSNVVASTAYGAGNTSRVEQTVHTSVALSLLFGFALIFVGLICAQPLLLWMETPSDIFSSALLYLRIYFFGMPAMMLYNFGAALLRVVGDTRRPLHALTVAGFLNIILNLFFVIVCHWDVAGVAWATVISQCLSALLIVYYLLQAPGCLRLDLHHIRIDFSVLVQILKIGLPSGLQGVIFSLSNVIIQGVINTFGSIAIAGNAAASSVDSFVIRGMNGFHQAAVTFSSQNAGAKKPKRTRRVLFLCAVCSAATGLLLGLCACFFGRQLLSLYSKDAAVIEIGLIRIYILCAPYFLFGIMDASVGVLRGLGYAVLPTVISLAGCCGFRLLWIATAFRACPTLSVLYFGFPASWFVTGAVQLFFCEIALRKAANNTA